MTTTIQAIRSLKVGRYIVVDDAPCRIVEYITSKPGKHGEAKARIVAVGIFDGVKRSLVHPVKHKVHVPQVDNRKGQVLAHMGAEVQFMDLETSEFAGGLSSISFGRIEICRHSYNYISDLLPCMLFS